MGKGGRGFGARWPLWLGFIGTAVWIFGVYVYGQQKGWATLLALEPAEFGSLLQGIVAPIGFTWLVIGYLLQSIALKAQIQELQLQVESTTELARAAARREAREKLLAQPRFVSELPSRVKSSEGERWGFSIKNEGATATDIFVNSVSGGFQPEHASLQRAAWARGEQVVLYATNPTPGTINLEYTDSVGLQNHCKLAFDGQRLTITAGQTQSLQP